MTWQLGPTTGVIEAIDSQGKPFNVGPPPMMATDLADQAPVKHPSSNPACRGACQQGDEPCPHPDDCYVPADRDLQRVVLVALAGFWLVLLWWVLS